MHKKTLIIYIFMFLLSSFSVSAITQIFNWTTLTYDPGYGADRIDGYKLLTHSSNLTFNNITTIGNASCNSKEPWAFISDATGHLIAETQIINHVATFNVFMNDHSTYYILIGNKTGSAYNCYSAGSGYRNDTLIETSANYFYRTYNSNATAIPADSASQEQHGISTLTVTEFTPPVISNVTYQINTSQYPADLTSNMTDLDINATVTVNGTTLSNNDSMTLFYDTETTLNDMCSIFYQKNCVQDGLYVNKSMTKVNNSFFTVHLDDFEIFPGYYPFNQHYIDNTVHLNFSVYNNVNIKFNIFNFSTNTSQYFIQMEFNAINSSSGSTNLLIYYCNSSYISGNPATTINCVFVDSFSPTTSYAHTHNQSKHQVIPVVIANISKTQLSYFVFVNTGTLANAWNFQYVTNSSYDNTSFNTGNYNSWGSTVNIFDIHVHEFLGSDYFSYYVELSNNGTLVNSSKVYDFYNLTAFPPSAPNILIPACNQSYTVGTTSLTNITFIWTNSTDINGRPFTYNLSISDGFSVKIINSSIPQNHAYYDYTDLNSISLLPGNYVTTVIACDDIGMCNDGIQTCSFNICQSSYVKSIQPCINGVELVNYTDINHCNIYGYDLPLDSGSYELCTNAPQQNIISISDMTWILIVLLLIFIVFLFLAIRIDMLFLVGDGLIMALFAFIFKQLFITSYTTIIFIIMLLLSAVFLFAAFIFHGKDE